MAKERKAPIEHAWQNWVECLDGEDTNSIFNQISLMTWDTAIFRIILRSRQNFIEKNKQAPEINESLHTFIDRNYFISQSSYIRRLTDKSYGLTEMRGIYSVNALINDILGYRNEFTRETFFKLRDLNIDITEAREKEREFTRNQLIGKGYHVPPELDSDRIEEVHLLFDRLCCVSQNNRKPEDLIDLKVFTRLQEKLIACQEITHYVDKFIAHSATPESRSMHDEETFSITLGQLWQAHQIIYEVVVFISVVLFSKGHVALAIEEPTFFDFWDKPMFENQEVGLVKNTLADYRNETNEWNSNAIEKIWRWVEEKY